MVRSRSRRSRRLLHLVHALVMVAVVAALTPTTRPAHAATLLVTTTADGGAGSLRDFIEDSSRNQIVDFAPSMAGQTITLTHGELFVFSAMTIQNTSGGQVTIDGNLANRVFRVGNNTTATIQGLVIQRGRDTNGGGVLVDAGATLTLDSMVIQDNVAQGPNGQDSGSFSVMTTGGGLGSGGGISNAGTLTIVNSVVNRNQAIGGAGGIGLATSGQPRQAGAGGGAGLGGGLFTSGTTTVLQSSFTANSARGGAGGSGFAGGGAGGGLGGAIFQQAGVLNVQNATADQNTAQGGAGGGDASGLSSGPQESPGPGAFGFGGAGGLKAGDGGVGGGGGGGAGLLFGSGRSGAGGLGGGGGGADYDQNGAGQAGRGGGNGRDGGGGGGGLGAGLFLYYGGATVVFSSFAGNVASGGGGGVSQRDATQNGADGSSLGGGLDVQSGLLRLRATLVSVNTAAAHPDLDGTLTSLGYNLVRNPDGATGLTQTDLINQDPLLYSFAGYPPYSPMYLHFQVDSPLADAIPPIACLDLSDHLLQVDELNLPRPIKGNSKLGCDIGAYEMSPALVQVTSASLTYTENDAPTPIDPGLTLSSHEQNFVQGATVLVGGYTRDQDQIGYTTQPGSTDLGITGAFDPATQSLTLTGLATLHQYQIALRSVTYQNTSNAPSTATRTAEFWVQGFPGMSNIAARQINVVSVEDPPAATNDSYTVGATQTLTVPAASGVLKNDTDLDSPASSLTARVVGGPAHGSLDLHADGGFVYTPAATFAGTDSFTYQTSDGSTTSNVATTTLTVTATACVMRPGIRTAPSAGGGKLSVHVETTQLNTGQNNALQRVVFGAIQNARVTLNGQAIAGGQTYTAPAGTFAVDFTVERVTPGQPTTVPLTVVDGCGEWHTFVGGGAGAGF